MQKYLKLNRLCVNKEKKKMNRLFVKQRIKQVCEEY